VTPYRTAMFAFPNRLTTRRSPATSSGVSGAGVIPESMGVAPSGPGGRTGDS
jgi:hypothetical protein